MSKPFGEDEDENLTDKPKSGLKSVSSQKSIFDSVSKKPTQDDLDKKVKSSQDRISSHKIKAAELNALFYKAVADKTLSKNKTLFQQDMEKDLLSKMLQLANEINNDPVEGEAIGTLVILVPLMKTCFEQRDKINNLEYLINQFESELKEIKQALDKKKNSE